MNRVVKAGVLYFAVVFAVGFVLGPIRELWAVPNFGRRAAELMEAPFMLIAIWLAARWTARRLASETRWARLQAGLVALGILLTVEFTVVLWLRGLSVTEYFEGRDPVTGAGYAILLAIFALAPVFLGR